MRQKTFLLAGGPQLDGVAPTTTVFPTTADITDHIIR